MEYYLTTRPGEIQPYATTRMNPEDDMLRERSRMEKNTHMRDIKQKAMSEQTKQMNS